MDKVAYYKEEIYKQAMSVTELKALINDSAIKADIAVDKIKEIGDNLVYHGAVHPTGAKINSIGKAIAQTGDRGSPAYRLGQRVLMAGNKVKAIPKEGLGVNTAKILGQFSRVIGVN